MQQSKRLDFEDRALQGLGIELKALLGLNADASTAEFDAALAAQWDAMPEAKRNRVVYVALETAELGERVMGEIQNTTPGAAAEKSRFTRDAEILKHSMTD
ncbi:MAG: hypothetical protein JRN62_02945 [Nitrososphaerota archaeon]|jgi:hypothetical protein|nr:hypothetical protein [Nitrososphaerota archaeon]MDG6948951.1 hypothetical protein [Nitrososphaerota archaeon]